VLERFGAAADASWALAAAAYGRALLADDGEAESHFQRALAVHAYSPRLPDRARIHLAFGEHLRRVRRRVDAREHLRTALAHFEDLSASRWAERAAQERQVAALVRQGLSNRDVATQLFVSPRTVDFHLRNCYSKLGVSSHAELTALPLDLGTARLCTRDRSVALHRPARAEPKPGAAAPSAHGMPTQPSLAARLCLRAWV
jgi:DNA-binding CsgD family transcriptional regulator